MIWRTSLNVRFGGGHSITAHYANSSRACFLIRITIKAFDGLFAAGAAGEAYGRIDLTTPRTSLAVKDSAFRSWRRNLGSRPNSSHQRADTDQKNTLSR